MTPLVTDADIAAIPRSERAAFIRDACVDRFYHHPVWRILCAATGSPDLAACCVYSDLRILEVAPEEATATAAALARVFPDAQLAGVLTRCPALLAVPAVDVAAADAALRALLGDLTALRVAAGAPLALALPPARLRQTFQALHDVFGAVEAARAAAVRAPAVVVTDAFDILNCRDQLCRMFDTDGGGLDGDLKNVRRRHRPAGEAHEKSAALHAMLVAGPYLLAHNPTALAARAAEVRRLFPDKDEWVRLVARAPAVLCADAMAPTEAAGAVRDALGETLALQVIRAAPHILALGGAAAGDAVGGARRYVREKYGCAPSDPAFAPRMLELAPVFADGPAPPPGSVGDGAGLFGGGAGEAARKRVEVEGEALFARAQHRRQRQ